MPLYALNYTEANNLQNNHNNNTRRPAHRSAAEVQAYQRAMAQRQQAAGQRQDAYAQQRSAAARRAAAKRRKTIRRKKMLRRVSAVLLVVALAAGGLTAWFFGTANSIVKRGNQGALDPLIATQPEYKGDVVNVLILGLDQEEGRTTYNTDMILYAHFDRVNKKLSLLQIPRDIYPGDKVPTGNSGKINAVYTFGADQENPVNNLASLLYDQFKLPVDGYLTMDMDAFKEIVDRFQGITVYVSKTMDFDGSHLDVGWRKLMGDEAEFFVRNRKGVGFENADIDRLENQRYFYSAFFKRVKEMTSRDIIKLMPVFTYFCNTSFSVTDCMALAIDLLTIPSENITFARMPSYQALEEYSPGSWPINCAIDQTADLLNQYFRAEGELIPASELNVYQYKPNYDAFYDSAVSTMGDVEATEDPNAPSN